MNQNIFREYDIRGIVGKDLTDETVKIVAKSIGSFFNKSGAKTIAVGFDARKSSPKFCKILTEELNKVGCDVRLIGRVPTPVLYHTVYTKDVDGGAMITGSHNPSNYNGFKICLGEETLYGVRIQEIKKIALSGDFSFGRGNTTKLEVLKNYKTDILSRIKLGQKRLKVVIDAGNGMGGITSVPIYQELGAELIQLYTKPDSNFPNHPPDPAVPENLKDAINSVKENSADLAIAFDGDADRITVIDDQGNVIWGDELTTLFAREILPGFRDAAVIGEVKCSQVLFDETKNLGGKPIMCKAGHSIVKAKMKETGAILAGEMSGHIFFRDRYYGFDDACYAGARLLEILSRTDKSLSELRSHLPKIYSTPEIRINCEGKNKFQIVKNVAEKFSKTNEVVTIDGARIIFKSGWGLVRASNTQEILVLRCEANNEENLAAIKSRIESTLDKFL